MLTGCTETTRSPFFLLNLSIALVISFSILRGAVGSKIIIASIFLNYIFFHIAKWHLVKLVALGII